MADSQFEYREEQDYINIDNFIEETKTSQQAKHKAASKNNNGGGGKKVKKIIVVKTPDPVAEEEKEYPHLIQARPQTAASKQSNTNTAAWNLITNDKIKKAEEQKQNQKKEKITPYIDKQQFPTLPRD